MERHKEPMEQAEEARAFNNPGQGSSESDGGGWPSVVPAQNREDSESRVYHEHSYAVCHPESTSRSEPTSHVSAHYSPNSKSLMEEYSGYEKDEKPEENHYLRKKERNERREKERREKRREKKERRKNHEQNPEKRKEEKERRRQRRERKRKEREERRRKRKSAAKAEGNKEDERRTVEGENTERRRSFSSSSDYGQKQNSLGSPSSSVTNVPFQVIEPVMEWFGDGILAEIQRSPVSTDPQNILPESPAMDYYSLYNECFNGFNQSMATPHREIDSISFPVSPVPESSYPEMSAIEPSSVLFGDLHESLGIPLEEESHNVSSPASTMSEQSFPEMYEVKEPSLSEVLFGEFQHTSGIPFEEEDENVVGEAAELDVVENQVQEIVGENGEGLVKIEEEEMEEDVNVTEEENRDPFYEEDFFEDAEIDEAANNEAIANQFQGVVWENGEWFMELEEEEMEENVDVIDEAANNEALANQFQGVVWENEEWFMEREEEGLEENYGVVAEEGGDLQFFNVEMEAEEERDEDEEEIIVDDDAAVMMDVIQNDDFVDEFRVDVMEERAEAGDNGIMINNQDEDLAEEWETHDINERGEKYMNLIMRMKRGYDFVHEWGIYEIDERDEEEEMNVVVDNQEEGSDYHFGNYETEERGEVERNVVGNEQTNFSQFIPRRSGRISKLPERFGYDAGWIKTRSTPYSRNVKRRVAQKKTPSMPQLLPTLASLLASSPSPPAPAPASTPPPPPLPSPPSPPALSSIQRVDVSTIEELEEFEKLLREFKADIRGKLGFYELQLVNSINRSSTTIRRLRKAQDFNNHEKEKLRKAVWRIENEMIRCFSAAK